MILARCLPTKSMWWHRTVELLPVTDTDVVELADGNPYWKRKGVKQVAANPDKAEEEQTQQGLWKKQWCEVHASCMMCFLSG